MDRNIRKNMFQRLKVKREAKLNKRTLLRVTACSNCDARLSKCRCGHNDFQIAMLGRAFGW